MHGDGFLRANAGLATAVLGGPTFPITECNKGNKGNNIQKKNYKNIKNKQKVCIIPLSNFQKYFFY